MMSDTAAIIDVIFKGLEILAIVIGGGGVAYRIGRATMKFEEVADNQSVQIGELKADVKALNTLIADSKLMDQRLTDFGDRMNRTERRVDLMATGEGFIFPFDKSRKPA